MTLGLVRATARFIEEYALEMKTWPRPSPRMTNFGRASVRIALVSMLKHPRAAWIGEEWAAVAQKFDDVLPGRRNRQRVDRAVGVFLRYLAEEVWHLPALKPIYELQMQRISIERAEAMLREVQGLRADFQQTMLCSARGLDQQRQL